MRFSVLENYLHKSRSILQQLKTLETGIDTIRNASSNKPRFAFKRSAKAPIEPSHSASTPAPSSSSLPAASPSTPSSTQLSISNRQNSWLTLESLDAAPGVLPSQSSLSISELSSCVVNLLAPTSVESKPTVHVNALHIRRMRRVVLIAGYIDGSLLIHDCEDCLLILGCRQVSIILWFVELRGEHELTSFVTLSVSRLLVSDAYVEECDRSTLRHVPTCSRRVHSRPVRGLPTSERRNWNYLPIGTFQIALVSFQ